MPRDHVLTKTFFLLKDFPGRFASGQLWVEAIAPPNDDEPERPARGGDGVSSILITSNDLAGAWAQRPTASRCCRWCRASRASASSRSAPASTS